MKGLQMKVGLLLFSIFLLVGLFIFFELHQKSRKSFFEKTEYILFYIHGDDKEDILFGGVAFLSNETNKFSFLTIYSSTLLDIDKKQITFRDLFKSYTHSEILSFLSDYLKLPIKHHISLSLSALGDIIHLLEGVSVYIPFFNRLPTEELPQEPFVLDGILLKSFLHPEGNSHLLPVIHISRYYSLIFSFFNEFQRKKELFESKKLSRIILDKFYTTLKFENLQKIWDQLILFDEIKSPMFIEVGVSLKNDNFVLDIEETHNLVQDCLHYVHNTDESIKTDLLQLLIHNGTNYTGLAKGFRDFLISKEVQVFEFSNADHAKYKDSYLINVSGKIRGGLYLSRLLGIKNVYYAFNKTYLVDAVLILGDNYKELKYE